MINNIVLTGRITHDLEEKTTNSNKKYVNFSIAVSRLKDETDFIDCIAWNKTAEIICASCSKGSLVGVEGGLRVDSYTDKDGNKRKSTKVLINKVTFLDSKKKTKEQETEEEKNEFEDYDLPF